MELRVTIGVLIATMNIATSKTANATKPKSYATCLRSCRITFVAFVAFVAYLSHICRITKKSKYRIHSSIFSYCRICLISFVLKKG